MALDLGGRSNGNIFAIGSMAKGNNQIDNRTKMIGFWDSLIRCNPLAILKVAGRVMLVQFHGRLKRMGKVKTTVRE